MNRLTHANKDAKASILFSLGGWVVLGLLGTGGPIWFRLTMRFVALLCVVIGIALGGQVLHLRRVPKWARPFLGDSAPDAALGASALLLSLSLLVGIILP